MASSEKLGVELYGLYRAGKVTIPLIANQFVAANGKVNQTQDNSKAAFTQISGDVSQVYDSWADLRDKLQGYTGKSGEHMHNIANGLITIMERYRDQDETAANKLDSLIEEGENYDGDLVTPDEVPDYTEPTYPE